MSEIPKYDDIMLPLLKLTKDRKEHSVRELLPDLANTFNLSKEDMAQMLPSGNQAIFTNRCHWAKTYLSKAGLINNSSFAS